MLDRFLAVERLNAWISSISSWALLAMTLIVGFEVFSRYVMNTPTIWAWDINVQLMLLLMMLGMAEAYRRDAHVRVDVLTSALSPRARAVIEVLFAPVFLLVACTIAWTGWEYFLDSYSRGQTASTIFAPPLYPIKFMLPLGGALLVLQGVVKLIRDIRVVIHGRSTETGNV
jgi:TRAP-type mannitol/chloroaromatic compound transport system permease small subunit